MSSNWTDERLEATLHELRDEVFYPTTPPFAISVRGHLALRPAPPRRWGVRRPQLWQAAAALLVVCLMAMLVLPEAREAVADRLGLRGIRITQEPEPGRLAPMRDPRRLLGAPVELEGARSSVGFPILLPTLAGLGQPDEVFLKSGRPAEVSLVYGPRPGLPRPSQSNQLTLIISQTAGHQVGPFYEKGAGPRTQVQYVDVGREVGIWLDGTPHRFQYLGPDGAGQVGEARLAANVLVWEQDARIIRIEGSMSQDVAVRIARSLR